MGTVSVLMSCVLGAGFVSGQEIYLFFGRFGALGIVGLFLSVLLLAFFFYLLLRCVAKDPQTSPCVPARGRFLSGFVKGIELSFLFVVWLIMAAGVGALFATLFDSLLFRVLGGLFFAALVCVLVLLGTARIIRYFSFVTPLLVLLAIGISLFAIFNGELAFSGEPSILFLPNALSYLSYNFLGAIGMFTAFGMRMRERRTAGLGAVLGGLLLFLTAGAILLALFANPAAREAELPMLAVAQGVHPVLYYGYAVLLLVAMLGAALSVASPLFEELSALCRIRNRRVPFAILLSLAVFCLSLFGFADLVGTLYPIYGYIGFLFLAFLLYHFFHMKKRKK